MDRMIIRLIMLGQIMNLRMAVVAGRNGIGRAGCQDLVKLHFPVFTAGFGIPGLEKPPAAAAAEII